RDVVLGEDADPVAPADAEPGEAARERVHAPRVLAEGDLLLAVDDGGRLAVGGGTPLDHVVGGEAVHAHGAGDRATAVPVGRLPRGGRQWRPRPIRRQSYPTWRTAAMSLVDPEDLAQLLPAETAAFASPIPTQFVSSDEFTPLPQTARQRQVEARVKAL